MLTRLILASPSIWAPDRKKASIRPWPAQSNNSRPPSVKKFCRRLPSSETYGRPPPRSRASIAAAAGIGDEAPTATWRASPISPAMLLASSSSSRKISGGALVMDVLVKIGREPFRGRRHARIAREVHRVRRIMVGQPERPCALRRHRDRLEIEAAERAGREPGIVEQIPVVQLLHRHHRLVRGMRHGGKLAVAA